MNTCKHIFVAGPNKGTVCGRFCRPGGNLCGQHKSREMYKGVTTIESSQYSRNKMARIEENELVIVRRTKAAKKSGQEAEPSAPVQ